MPMLKNKLLELDAKENVNLEELLAKIRITDFAFQKAKAYAKAVIDVSGINLECGGFLLGKNDEFDGIVVDACLLSEQSVTGASFMGNIDKTREVLEEAKNSNKKVVGWWHSHNEMGTFHSDDDDNYMKQLFLSIAPYNRIAIGRKTVYLTETGLEVKYFIENVGEKEGGKESCGNEGSCREQRIYIRLVSKDSPNKIFDIEVEDFIPIKELKVKNIVERQFFGTSFAYSMVINSLDAKPYTEIWYENIKTSNITKIKTKGVDIVECAGGFSGEILGEKVSSFRELYELAKKEVAEKVKYNGISIKEYTELERKRQSERERAETWEMAKREAQKDVLEKLIERIVQISGEKQGAGSRKPEDIRKSESNIIGEKKDLGQIAEEEYTQKYTQNDQKANESAVKADSLMNSKKFNQAVNLDESKGVSFGKEICKDGYAKDDILKALNNDKCDDGDREINGEKIKVNEKLREEGYNLQPRQQHQHDIGKSSKPFWRREDTLKKEESLKRENTKNFRNYEKTINNYLRKIDNDINHNRFLNERELVKLKKEMTDIYEIYARIVKYSAFHSREEGEKAAQGITLIKKFCNDFAEYKKKYIMKLEQNIADTEKDIKEKEDENKKSNLFRQFYRLVNNGNKLKADCKRLGEYQELLSYMKNFDIGFETGTEEF